MMEMDWDFGEGTKGTVHRAHHKAKQRQSPRPPHERTHQDDIAAALQGLHHRLDTLASISEATILIPGKPQEHYHQIVEEAYAVLGLIETEVDELRAELEYEHKRLEEARDHTLQKARKQDDHTR